MRVGGFCSALFAILVVTVVGAGLAWACGPSAYISVTPYSGPAGGRVTVDGRFTPDRPVEIRFDSTSGPLLATPRSDAEGRVSATVAIPEDASEGTHTVVAQATDSEGRVTGRAAAPFEVTMPHASVSPASVPAGGQAAFEGRGFVPDKPVEIRFDSTSGPLLATHRPGADGTLSATVTIPEHAAEGIHYVLTQVIDSKGRVVGKTSTALEVTRPPLTELRVGVDPNRGAGAQDFEILTTGHALVELTIKREGRVLFTRSEVSDGSPVLLGYAWGCRRPGDHTWTVTATDGYGNHLERSGRFAVPRCYTRRGVALRREVVRYIKRDFRPQEFVSEIACRNADGSAGARADAHRCFVRWSDLRRQCEATYVFRALNTVRTGRVLDEYFGIRRKTRIRCREFY